MVKRPKPTKPLILEVCGGNQGLISSIHHGLHEVTLTDFYSNLNFDEALAFAAGSWLLRKERHRGFRQAVSSGEIYAVFSQAFNVGLPFLNAHKSVTKENSKKYGRLNPFPRGTLRTRFKRFSIDAEDSLRKRLLEDVKTYVFWCQYGDAKRARDGFNVGLEIMYFQNAYPKKGKIVPAFAAEVSRIIGKYPRDYELAEQEKPAKPSVVRASTPVGAAVQGSLF